eukprot:3751601-Pleurochrysis_carterae.AAC.2
MVVVAGFTALWLVANELEDPFGSDDNDIDIVSYHAHFCESISSLVSHGWLVQDQWTTAEGRWVDPRLPKLDDAQEDKRPMVAKLLVKKAQSAHAHSACLSVCNSKLVFAFTCATSQRLSSKFA